MCTLMFTLMSRNKDRVRLGRKIRTGRHSILGPHGGRFRASPMRQIRSLLYAALLAGGCLAGARGLSAQQGVPPGISLTTKLRVQDTVGWWPTKGSAAKEQYVGNTQCARCHAAKAAGFDTAAMAHAAVRAENSEVFGKHDSLELQLGPYHYELQKLAGKASLKVSDAKASLSLPLLWGFGNGRMGQTYISEQNGSYYESHVSFYVATQSLDITPGQSRAIPGNLESAAGRRMSPEEAKLCFGCHTTASAIKGQFDPDALVAGVACEACHGPGLNHVAAENSGAPEPGDSLILNPARLDRIDSVDFCGACHRTWEDVLTSGNLGIFNVRFAPYRLENSECWKQGDKRISCIACHDPHKPLSHDAGSYDSVCLQCHSKPATQQNIAQVPAVCPVATKECVTCHMPKYEPPGLHSSFTDHWIRIVRAREPYPE